MMLPVSPSRKYFPSSRPTGAPAMVRTPPKLLWTRAPSVQPPNFFVSLRLEVPMPPFQPKATVPRPAPTLPSSTGPVFCVHLGAQEDLVRERGAGLVAELLDEGVQLGVLLLGDLHAHGPLGLAALEEALH